MSLVSGPAAVFDALAIGTEIQRRIGVKTSRDEPLGRFTTIRLGGHAVFTIDYGGYEITASTPSQPPGNDVAGYR